jgi:preprotein translocase subunit YajC
MLHAVLLFAQDAAPKAAPDAAPFWASFMPLILIMLAFVFLIVLPARRRERMQRELLFNALKKDDEVITTSGIIGIVANIKDNEVTLKVDESSNVRLRVLRSSIAQILPKEGAKDGAKKGGSETSVKAGSPPGK